MLRIGQFTDTFLPIVDGVGRVALAYAETLSHIGHEVTVSAPMYNTGHRGGYPFELVDYTAMRVPTAPQYRTGTASLDLRYRRRMDMIPLDIVHAHSPFGAGREALRISKERGIPLVASFHSKYYDDFYKVLHSDSLAKMVVANVVRFYRKCDEVWAVSETTAKVLESYGYEGPIRVVPNGATMRLASDEAVRLVEERFQLGEKPLLLYVGQINWKKNLACVLDAAALLAKQGEDFALLMAGQGPDTEQVQSKIDELHLNDRVRLIGHISETHVLDALYARAIAFTFPSLYDNAPMVVREAAVMGTPAVLVAGSDAAEIIHDGANGFLCRDDANDLSRVLTDILNNPDRAKEVGAAARETIPLPWEDVMQQVTGYYEHLIALHAGRRKRTASINTNNS
ncbi:MAG: glycosyltransferase [Christensenellales bacterium]